MPRSLYVASNKHVFASSKPKFSEKVTPMSNQNRRVINFEVHPALRHGAYSGLALLPGESEAGFRKLRDGLYAEYKPNTPSLRYAVDDMTRYMWRLHHLYIYRFGEEARRRLQKTSAEFVAQAQSEFMLLSSRRVHEAKVAAEERARDELTSAWTLVELGDVLTFDYLTRELEIAERLERAIERCIKRIVLTRGVHSLTPSLSSSQSSKGNDKAA